MRLALAALAVLVALALGVRCAPDMPDPTEPPPPEYGELDAGEARR